MRSLLSGVIALGLTFSPFTIKTLIFMGASLLVFFILPCVTQWFFGKYGGRVSELETKYLLFLLFGLAAWQYGPAAKRSCQPI